MVIGYCKEHGTFSDAQTCPRCAIAPPEAPTVIRTGGLDLAKFHDFTAMTELDVSFHSAKLKAVKVWPHVDYSLIIDEVAGRYAKVGMRQVGVDATGVGEPIAEMLRKLNVVTEDVRFGDYVDYTNPWGLTEHAPVKYAMVEYFRACSQSGFLDLGVEGKGELGQQLGEQEIVQGASERIQYAHPEGRHDDLAWAFLINLYVSRKWITGAGGWMRGVAEI